MADKKVSSKLMRSSKETFGNLFLILVTALMILPLFTTVNQFMTRIVENTALYWPIEKFIVPYEINLVRVLLSATGISTIGGQAIFQVIKDGIPEGIYISWNCVGWQSLVILLVSLKTGLTRDFTRSAKLEITALAIAGTFLINILRIYLVIVIYYFFGKLPAAILHDYGSILITIIWLFAFWWFIYRNVTEVKEGELI